MDLEKIQLYGLEVQEAKKEIQELENLQSKTIAKIKILKQQLKSKETMLLHCITKD
jgi:hypothetical protein